MMQKIGHLVYINLLLILAVGVSVDAHPLGTLRVDAITEITITSSIIINYNLRLPEATAFPQIKLLDKDGDKTFTSLEKEEYLTQLTPKLLKNIKLEVNSKPVSLTPVNSAVKIISQPGGLYIMKINYVFKAKTDKTMPPEGELRWEDNNFTGTPGWKEIKVKSSQHWQIINPPSSPKNIKQANMTKVNLNFISSPADNIKEETTKEGVENIFPAIPEKKGGLLDLFLNFSQGVVPLLLLGGIAILLGSAHALTPGHGKTLVSAYLIGTRGTVGQAILLGIVVTITHTFSIILLGLISLYAFKYLMPVKVIPWISFSSGLSISIIGIILLYKKVFTSITSCRPHPHTHGDNHYHSHNHTSHHHHHHSQSEVTLGGLLLLGISGGIVPCSDALLVLLSAISLNKIALGLLVILMFSLGLAISLILIGILAVKARAVLEKFTPSQSVLSKITAFSYIILIILGFLLAYQALASAGI